MSPAMRILDPSSNGFLERHIDAAAPDRAFNPAAPSMFAPGPDEGPTSEPPSSRSRLGLGRGLKLTLRL